MKCLHCRVEIHPGFAQQLLLQGHGLGIEGDTPTCWAINYMSCPACKKALITVTKMYSGSNLRHESWAVYPRKGSRTAAPVEVPADLAEDFNEAGQVLELSPKASAALSRRCLQALLQHQGFVHKDLAPAIQAALDSKQIPGMLATNLDAIRNIGNFAAHPLKDKQSGSILPVEPEEAEWNLEVLEGLFDFFYVQPAKDAARVAALNAKLAAAGKPAIKSLTP